MILIICTKRDSIDLIEMYESVTRCEEIDELRELLDKCSSYYTLWRDYINDILINNDLSYEKLGKITGFSKNTIKSWVTDSKVPRNREYFIKFCLGMRYNISEMNFILQRYGKYPKLYPKSIEDAICIYVIFHYPEDESNARACKYGKTLPKRQIRMYNIICTN